MMMSASRVRPRTAQRGRASRWLYLVDYYSSQSAVAMAAGMLLVASIAVGIALHFPNSWTVAFEAGTSSITLVMVLVIQHTQSREQLATQRKLDELLRVMPGAHAGLMLLEEASEQTMREVEDGQRHLKHHHAR